MPSANVRWPTPLTRQNPWYPGQLPGVPGTDSEEGLRMSCTGVVFWVDPNHVDTNDNRDGTNPTAPLTTVAAALTKCQAYRGDVIAVMANDGSEYAGTSDYNTIVTESVIVTVPGVRIVGVNPSGTQGVWWRPATVDGICITVYAMDVCVEGFAFQGNAGGTGVYAEYGGAATIGDNTTVRHCCFDADLDEGIWLDYSWNCDIHHNSFDESLHGIYTSNVNGDVAYARIHHNWFQDCETGAIWLPDADRCHIYENYIYNNDAASGAGAPTNSMINLASGSRNLVHKNTLSCLLPVPAAWDYDACNTAGAGDAWCQNYCTDGPSVTNPT